MMHCIDHIYLSKFMNSSFQRSNTKHKPTYSLAYIKSKPHQKPQEKLVNCLISKSVEPKQLKTHSFLSKCNFVGGLFL